MTTKKVKRTLMEIGNVRIIESDALNVEVQRLESGIKPVTKEVVLTWRFKAFCRTIKTALKLIVENELLVDRNDIKDAESYLDQIAMSEITMLNAIENRYGE